MSLSQRSLSSTLAAACLLSVSLLAGTAAQAATTVNLSYNGAPDPEKNAVHLFATNLKELVAEKTGGELELRLYPNSQLGEEQARMEQTMSSPNLNIASFAGISPVMPEIYVSAIPFLFEDFKAARSFFDEGAYWRAFDETLRERTGIEMLAVVEEGGFLAFTNNDKPIRSPGDFQGPKPGSALRGLWRFGHADSLDGGLYGAAHRGGGWSDESADVHRDGKPL